MINIINASDYIKIIRIKTIKADSLIIKNKAYK